MKIAVIGSLNLDSTMHVDHFPMPGETLLASSSSSSIGGKGANQASALAKVGAEVNLLGCVGNDLEGEFIIKGLVRNGVNTEFIRRDNNRPTGRANIVVASDSNNNIIVAPGANGGFGRTELDGVMNGLKDADAALFQLEIPIDTVHYALQKAKEMGKITILNPAPYQVLSDELINLVDIIIPNEVELAQLIGVQDLTEKDLKEACALLAKDSQRLVIVTLGDKGCYVYQNKKGQMFAAYQIQAIDTTAAGDSFIGGFLYYYLKEEDLQQAIDFGQKVAAITVSRKGAADSIPNAQEVRQTNLKKHMI